MSPELVVFARQAKAVLGRTPVGSMRSVSTVTPVPPRSLSVPHLPYIKGFLLLFSPSTFYSLVLYPHIVWQPCLPLPLQLACTQNQHLPSRLSPS
jgi:hypothetical protein